MGLFSSLFSGKKSSGIVNGRNPGSNWVAANKFNKARGGYAGGYGAWTFGNIMRAHCTPDDIVDEFRLDKDDNPYGCDAYLMAYQEEYDIAFKEYEDLMGFYMELIEMNESIISENEHEITEHEQEIEELEEQIEQLEEEIEDLQDDMAFADDPDEMMDIMEEIEEIRVEIEEHRERIAELRERIEELKEQNINLQDEIYGWYAEMETISVEEFIDFDEVEKKAREYAAEFAQEWIDGNVWIPREVLDWAYYEVSDHNR